VMASTNEALATTADQEADVDVGRSSVAAPRGMNNLAASIALRRF
jgi:hypothetical protein